MRTFKDARDHTWTLAMNMDAVHRVIAVAGVNLSEAGDGDLIAQLSQNMVLFAHVLYAMCKPEADAQNMSDADFAKGLSGDVIETATATFLAELTDFFPRSRRELIKKAVGKMETIQKLAAERLGERIDQMDAEKVVAGLLSRLPTNSPESSASTPAP